VERNLFNRCFKCRGTGDIVSIQGLVCLTRDGYFARKPKIGFEFDPESNFVVEKVGRDVINCWFGKELVWSVDARIEAFQLVGRLVLLRDGVRCLRTGEKFKLLWIKRSVFYEQDAGMVLAFSNGTFLHCGASTKEGVEQWGDLVWTPAKPMEDAFALMEPRPFYHPI
jgi:hypothetical protein